MQPQPDAPRVVGVKRLADYLKRKLENDLQLRGVAVRGEVSNRSLSPRGHVNFDLKEGDAVLRCFAWDEDFARFPRFANGTAIVATGSLTTFAQKSSYQLVVRAVVCEGTGDVHTLFEARKKRLAAEGLFDPARKRALPSFPFRVALVSSRSANGALDFVTLLRERAPHVRVVWCETSVQGPNAPADIVAALGRASREDVDAIVLTRGGGSFEDLFAFSDEGVVRAVARARHPVVSAIGHTADQQLCDFAADVHLETPSAAAKALGFAGHELRARLEDRSRRARRAVDLCSERLHTRLRGALVRSKLTEPRSFLVPALQRLEAEDAALAEATAAALRRRATTVQDVGRRLEAHDPSRRLADRALRLERARVGLEPALRRRLERAVRRLEGAGHGLDAGSRAALQRARQTLALAGQRLVGSDPETILQRGYAIVTFGDAIVRDSSSVPAGEIVEARLARGSLRARVEPS